MICPTCKGRRYVAAVEDSPIGTMNAEVCQECGGWGEVHCCDGHQPSVYETAIGAQLAKALRASECGD